MPHISQYILLTAQKAAVRHKSSTDEPRGEASELPNPRVEALGAGNKEDRCHTTKMHCPAGMTKTKGTYN